MPDNHYVNCFFSVTNNSFKVNYSINKIIKQKLVFRLIKIVNT